MMKMPPGEAGCLPLGPTELKACLSCYTHHLLAVLIPSSDRVFENSLVSLSSPVGWAVSEHSRFQNMFEMDGMMGR